MIRQWSYSRFTTYDKCPAKAKYLYIDKIKDKGNANMSRGTIIHSKAEQLVKGNITGMPKELENFKDELQYLKILYKKGMVFVERDLAVTKDWDPTTYDDWNNVWLRGKSDVVVIEDTVATDVDYKTGKKYDSHFEQGELYAIGSFCHFPQIKSVDVEFWYIDSGEVEGASYNKKDLNKLKKKWEKKTRPMLTDKEFKPKPGYACQWCNFAASKGGPCDEG